MRLALPATLATFATSLALLACASMPGPAPSPDDVATGGDTPAGLARCTGRPFEAPAATGWDDLDTELTTAAGSPRHHAQDRIVPPGRAGDFHARFAYGRVLKDLEEERATLYVDDCTGWREVGDAITDEDGRASFTLPADLSIGVHEARVVARGDATGAVATIWVLPEGTRLVVTDIDGTLTTSDGELFEQLLDGEHVPEPYPGAAALTGAHAERGHVVVYLTGRPYWLLDLTRGWLDEIGAARGPLHVADSHTEILPTEDSVGAYKRAWLEQLQADGYVIDAAYGNATTDIYAYAGAGLSVDRTWIIGDHAGEGGTIAVDGSWEPRAAEVAASAPVDQPY